jgi:hypothetical protein
VIIIGLTVGILVSYTSLYNTKLLEVITAKCFHKCRNNKQFIPRVYMFINHKMTHRYIYFRFTRLWNHFYSWYINFRGFRGCQQTTNLNVRRKMTIWFPFVWRYWNFTKNVLHLFVLMLYVQAILFFLIIHPLFFFINQHFIKQYTNTGSYYCNFFSINVTIINNLFQEFTCL